MLSVKGTFQNGVARPVSALQDHEGEPVIITFVEEGASDYPPQASAEGWDSLFRLIEECAVDTGIRDLADEHDHYLYGTPKKG